MPETLLRSLETRLRMRNSIAIRTPRPMDSGYSSINRPEVADFHTGGAVLRFLGFA